MGGATGRDDGSHQDVDQGSSDGEVHADEPERWENGGQSSSCEVTPPLAAMLDQGRFIVSSYNC